MKNRHPWAAIPKLIPRKVFSEEDYETPSTATSGASNTSISDEEKARQYKSAPYARSDFEEIAIPMGCNYGEHNDGILEKSSKLCDDLLNSAQTYPKHSMFRDEMFNEAHNILATRNEATIVEYIRPLLVPSVYGLYFSSGAIHLKLLEQSLDQAWEASRPFFGCWPQPDYAVGFARTAFTDDQLAKLTFFIGDIPSYCASVFMGTSQMYFPFFTCEVKSDGGLLPTTKIFTA
jgi:hypothetical protein